MKQVLGIFMVLGFISFPTSLFSQLDVYKYIGKSQSQLIKNLGPPVHIDNSNPSMVMLFYRSTGLAKSFVSNREGIYQAEANQSFDSEKGCRAALNECLSDLIKNGFTVDTVSVSEFNSNKTGIKCKLNFSQNELNKKFIIYITSQKSEY